jgi:class 3 adenylate cyclase
MSYTNVFGNGRLMYRLVVAVDVEKYSTRDALGQLRAQTELQRILNVASQNAGLDQREWYEQVSGDGELVVLPEDVDVSAVVGDFTCQLEMMLAEVNRRAITQTPLRLRVAMHHGTLTPGPFGPAGDAPIVVSRLLDAKPLRKLLADQQDRDLALIVSQTLFQDVVRTGFCSLDPDEFQAVRVNAKGVQYHGFVRNQEEQRMAPAALRRASGGGAGLVALPGGLA